MGDVHQPLHAASYFSTQFPNGDRGGNLWNVSGFNWTTELHALWDGGLGQWYGDLNRPLNASGVQWVEDLSSKVISLYPVASMEPYIKEYNASTWANESFAIAENFCYTAPPSSPNPNPIPDAYLAEGREIVLKQIAIAGYRLADLLQFIFTSPADSQYTRIVLP